MAQSTLCNTKYGQDSFFLWLDQNASLCSWGRIQVPMQERQPATAGVERITH